MSVVSKINNVFEVNLTKQDDDWTPKAFQAKIWPSPWGLIHWSGLSGGNLRDDMLFASSDTNRNRWIISSTTSLFP
jgi:hypothetical protein